MLRKQDWQDALYSQGACNASGLIRSLAAVTSRIWDEARSKDQGTDYVNQHPIIVLYLEQLCHLSGTTLDHPRYSEAYKICQDMAAAE